MNKKNEVVTYRQGDCLIKRVDSIPADAKKVDWSKENRVVLAYGEVTGHAHALEIDLATEFRTEAGKRFINLKEEAVLRHEEHGPIAPGAGNFEVIQQVQYTPQGIRNVAD